jgi:ribosomal protein S18 acetylase RimI-like enzyme
MESGGRDLLSRIETYYDAVPRSAARVEEIPPFVLFIKEGSGWSYYARAQIGATHFTADDVGRVRARQREIGAPESFEWVAQTSPGLRAAAQDAGLSVTDHPLLVLVDPSATVAVPSGVTIRLATPEDDPGLLRAVANVGFSFPGTESDEAGTADVERARAGASPERDAFERERIARGLTVMAVAEMDGHPIAVGSHQPVGEVTEIVGVATLPAFRRRGIGAALTTYLTVDARARGCEIVFLSAGDDAVARVYERVGFERVATACIAEPSTI